MAAITMFIWWDKNSDGLQTEGEPGLAGFTGHLLGRDNVVLQTRDSTAGGRLDFDGLADGFYKIRMDRKPGWKFTIGEAGTGLYYMDNDFHGDFGGVSSLIRIEGGEHRLDIDAGYVRTRRRHRHNFGHFSQHGGTPYGTLTHGRRSYSHHSRSTVQPTVTPTIVPLPSTAITGGCMLAAMLAVCLITKKLSGGSK